MNVMKLLNWNEYVRLALSYANYSQNEDDSWTVEIPVLPGCVTWGETWSEVVLMAEDAVHSWLVTALRFGDDIPPLDGNSLEYLAEKTLAPEMAYA